MALAKDNKEYTYQHIVPRTYLEVWENENNFLKVRKYGSDKSFYKSSQSFMGENNYYTITADDYLIHSENDLKEIFGELRGYKIFLDGKELTELHEISGHYGDFDRWEIYNFDGTEADKASIKDSLSKKRVLDIELGFHNIESDWNIIRREIEKVCEDKEYKLNLKVADRLVNFLVTQKDRTEKRKQEYYKLFDIMSGGFKEYSEDVEYKKLIQEYTDAYFRKTVRKYQEGEEGTAGSVAEEQYRNLHTVFYKATGGKYFLTSDSPVMILNDKSIYGGKYNGLYMPVTPNIMVALYRGDNMSYTVCQMPVNLIRKLNRKLAKESTRFFIEMDKKKH